MGSWDVRDGSGRTGAGGIPWTRGLLDMRRGAFLVSDRENASSAKGGVSTTRPGFQYKTLLCDENGIINRECQVRVIDRGVSTTRGTSPQRKACPQLPFSQKGLLKRGVYLPGVRDTPFGGKRLTELRNVQLSATQSFSRSINGAQARHGIGQQKKSVEVNHNVMLQTTPTPNIFRFATYRGVLLLHGY